MKVVLPNKKTRRYYGVGQPQPLSPCSSCSFGTPGTHRYRFIADGEWRDDPECRSRAPNPFGGEDMLREAA